MAPKRMVMESSDDEEFVNTEAEDDEMDSSDDETTGMAACPRNVKKKLRVQGGRVEKMAAGGKFSMGALEKQLVNARLPFKRRDWDVKKATIVPMWRVPVTPGFRTYKAAVDAFRAHVEGLQQRTEEDEEIDAPPAPPVQPRQRAVNRNAEEEIEAPARKVGTHIDWWHCDAHVLREIATNL